MMIELFENAIKLMCCIDSYDLKLALINLLEFPTDNHMIINYDYHQEPVPEVKRETPVCRAGLPLGSCCGCGRCEW